MDSQSTQRAIMVPGKNKSTARDVLVGTRRGIVLRGANTVTVVVEWRLDAEQPQLVYFTPDGSLPELLPEIDDPELLTKLAILSWGYDEEIFDDDLPDPGGFSVSLVNISLDGTHLYQVDDLRDGQWFQCLVATEYSQGPTLATETVYYGSETWSSGDHRSYDEVVKLISSSEALVIADPQDRPTTYDELEGKLVVWDLTTINRLYAQAQADA